MNTEYTQVVACLDADDRAAKILERAKWVASLNRLPLTVLHVAPKPLSALSQGAEHLAVGEHCALSGYDFFHRLLTEAGLPSRALRVEIGEAAPVVAHLASQEPGTLLVMGVPRHTGVQRWLRSSSAPLVAASPCDILLVH